MPVARLFASFVLARIGQALPCHNLGSPALLILTGAKPNLCHVSACPSLARTKLAHKRDTGKKTRVILQVVQNKHAG